VSFLFLVGCPTATDVTQVFADPTKRAAALASHDASHNAAPFVAELEHPDNDPNAPAPTFTSGDAVTFYGSTTDQDAGLQAATVNTATAGTDQDSNAVDGYLIVVAEEGGSAYNVFVPPTSLHLV
jgi:hypothetical protein